MLLNRLNPVNGRFLCSNARGIEGKCFDADLRAVWLHWDGVNEWRVTVSQLLKTVFKKLSPLFNDLIRQEIACLPVSCVSLRNQHISCWQHLQNKRNNNNLSVGWLTLKESGESGRERKSQRVSFSWENGALLWPLCVSYN